MAYLTLTLNNHNFKNGDQALITGVSGFMAASLNDQVFTVEVVNSNVIGLVGTDVNAFSSGLSGGSVKNLSFETTATVDRSAIEVKPSLSVGTINITTGIGEILFTRTIIGEAYSKKIILSALVYASVPPIAHIRPGIKVEVFVNSYCQPQIITYDNLLGFVFSSLNIKHIVYPEILN